MSLASPSCYSRRSLSLLTTSARRFLNWWRRLVLCNDTTSSVLTPRWRHCRMKSAKRSFEDVCDVRSCSYRVFVDVHGCLPVRFRVFVQPVGATRGQRAQVNPATLLPAEDIGP